MKENKDAPIPPIQDLIGAFPLRRPHARRLEIINDKIVHLGIGKLVVFGGPDRGIGQGKVKLEGNMRERQWSLNDETYDDSDVRNGPRRHFPTHVKDVARGLAGAPAAGGGFEPLFRRNVFEFLELGRSGTCENGLVSLEKS